MKPPYPQNKFNLEDRTASFAEEVILFLKRIPFSPINRESLNSLLVLVDQLVPTTVKQQKRKARERLDSQDRNCNKRS